MAKAPKDPQPHPPTATRQASLAKLVQLRDEISQLEGRPWRDTSIRTWEDAVKLTLARVYGEHSMEFDQFDRIKIDGGIFGPSVPEHKHQSGMQRGMESARAYLQHRIAELQEPDVNSQEPVSETQPSPSRRVFVVHGHDHGIKETVARYLSKLNLDPIVLHEKPDCGRTVIEKFEDYSDVSCAIAILTADDVAEAREDPAKKEIRARQNVIFEFGFFVGKLGRKRAFALLENGVTEPSDIKGLLYICLLCNSDLDSR
jgi:predicted nucleotide-binding protein